MHEPWNSPSSVTSNDVTLLTSRMPFGLQNGLNGVIEWFEPRTARRGGHATVHHAAARPDVAERSIQRARDGSSRQPTHRNQTQDHGKAPVGRLTRGRAGDTGVGPRDFRGHHSSRDHLSSGNKGREQQNINPEALRFKRAAFYNSLKSKVGLAAAKAAALRINLNVHGCSIVAPPVHAPSRTPLLLPLLLSHNLPTPGVR